MRLLNAIDSSGWIEYFLGRPNSAFFRAAIHDTGNLIVPSISIHEVVRHVTRAQSREGARLAVAQMLRGRVVDLDAGLAEQSARLGQRHNLPVADAIIYATAQAHRATLYTQDADLAMLPGVKYVRAKSRLS